ncbi:MAG TPA: TRAP transporter substrate-binding protein DctP [Casimicrobiaceae bacterium]|nr:TRAP transporter substrate-binding protein DctP [Casimicrobiaceae bacterium]
MQHDSDSAQQADPAPETTSIEQPTRRKLLKAAGAAAVGATAFAPGPYIRTAAAETMVWKVQTSWPAGVGLQTFKTWCATIKEKTGGELEFKPFAAKEVVGDFELLDGVKNGVLEAMNSFTLYWAGKVPATAFLSSYLMGLRYPHEWDVFFYSNGGLQAARDLFAKQGLMYVNRIHHGPNIIHSKKPIRTINDFKDLKLRVPGGMIAEGFAAIGAKTTLLPGGEVFSALEKGTVDAADYTGPAVNWDLGFQQVTKYIWTGPVGLESIYQPVDLMDFCVRMDVYNKLSAKMKQWLDDEIQVYSNIHHAAIQKADMEAWGKFLKAGTQINRLPAEDLPKFQRVAVPIWFKWANKDPDAAKIFKLQLQVMESPTFGYVTPDMYKGLSINA